MKDPREDETTPTSPVRLSVLAGQEESGDPHRTLLQSVEMRLDALRGRVDKLGPKVEEAIALAKANAAALAELSANVGLLMGSMARQERRLNHVDTVAQASTSAMVAVKVLEERAAHLAKGLEKIEKKVEEVEETADDTLQRQAEAAIRKAAELDVRASHHELEKVLVAHVLEEKREEKRDDRKERHEDHADSRTIRADVAKLAATAVITLGLALLAQRFGLATAPQLPAPASAPAHSGH